MDGVISVREEMQLPFCDLRLPFPYLGQARKQMINIYVCFQANPISENKFSHRPANLKIVEKRDLLLFRIHHITSLPRFDGTCFSTQVNNSIVLLSLFQVMYLRLCFCFALLFCRHSLYASLTTLTQ